MKGNTNAVNGISKIMLHGQKLPITNQSVTIPDISKTAYGVAKAGEGIKVQNGVISSQSSVMNHVQLTCQEPTGDKLVLIDEHGGYMASGGVIGIPPFGYYIENPGAVTKRITRIEFDAEKLVTQSDGHLTVGVRAVSVLTGQKREIGVTDSLFVGYSHHMSVDFTADIYAEETAELYQYAATNAALNRQGNNFAVMPITYLIPE